MFLSNARDSISTRLKFRRPLFSVFFFFYESVRAWCPIRVGARRHVCERQTDGGGCAQLHISRNRNVCYARPVMRRGGYTTSSRRRRRLRSLVRAHNVAKPRMYDVVPESAWITRRLVARIAILPGSISCIYLRERIPFAVFHVAPSPLQRAISLRRNELG